jgi:hypothetical protein
MWVGIASHSGGYKPRASDRRVDEGGNEDEDDEGQKEDRDNQEEADPQDGPADTFGELFRIEDSTVGSWSVTSE